MRPRSAWRSHRCAGGRSARVSATPSARSGPLWSGARLTPLRFGCGCAKRARPRGPGRDDRPWPHHDYQEDLMQLISFARAGQIRSGGIEGLADPSMTRVIDLNAADPRLPADMLHLLRGGDELLDLARAVIQSAPPEMWLEIAGPQLLAPVPNPGKLICIGLNYRDHAAEAGLTAPGGAGRFRQAQQYRQRPLPSDQAAPR